MENKKTAVFGIYTTGSRVISLSGFTTPQILLFGAELTHVYALNYGSLTEETYDMR